MVQMYTRNVLFVATVQLAVFLMMTISYTHCSPSNGGRYMLVEEEEPPIVLVGAESSKAGSLNDILLDLEAKSAQSSQQQMPSPATGAEPSSSGSHQCRIEYQVTKVIPGWCTRLGRGSGRACVSGTHLVPFHPECM